MNLEEFPTSESAKRMLNYVTHGWYDSSYVGKWMYQVMGMENDAVKEYIDSLPYQFFPETASWGMYIHELSYGIPLHTGMDIDERRRIVLNKRDASKRLPMTPYYMESLIEAYFGLKTSVTEDNPMYLFKVDILDRPNNMVSSTEKLIKFIRKIKPSHMSMDLKHAVEKIYHRNYSQYAISLIEMALEVGEFKNETICIDVSFSVDMNTGIYSGGVLIYKSLNRWNGEHNFDGSIYFNSEFREEDL